MFGEVVGRVSVLAEGKGGPFSEWVVVEVCSRIQAFVGYSSSSGSSSKTDRWVHFQQNAGLRPFVRT